jgi:hypothetical protein
VYVSWSILAGQSHGQWGPEFPGMLQFSLRPGILNYFPGNGAAEYFQVSVGGFTLLYFNPFFFYSLHKVYRGG